MPTIWLDEEPFNSDLFSRPWFAFTPYVNDGFYSHRSVFFIICFVLSPGTSFALATSHCSFLYYIHNKMIIPTLHVPCLLVTFDIEQFSKICLDGASEGTRSPEGTCFDNKVRSSERWRYLY